MSLSPEVVTAESSVESLRRHKGPSRFLKEAARSRTDHIAVIATLTSARCESAAATVGATQNPAATIAPNSTMAISKNIVCSNWLISIILDGRKTQRRLPPPVGPAPAIVDYEGSARAASSGN